jgi:hypothetical protein
VVIYLVQVELVTEEYNGTSWSASNNLTTARESLAGSAGTQTAALAFGGTNAPGSASSN